MHYIQVKPLSSDTKWILFSIIILGILLQSNCQAIEISYQDGVLTIPLNDELRKNNLQFELDTVDVTSLIQFTKNAVKITLVKVLDQRSHQLKIYQLIKGHLQALSQYNFNIDKTESSTYLSDFKIETNLSAATTLLNSNKNSPHLDWSFDANSAISSEWKIDDWTINTQSDLFFDKNYRNNNQHMIELADYLINASTDNLSIQLGHHQIPDSSLILDGFHQRGLSSTWHSDAEDKVLTGFAFNSQSITGFRNGLGLSNKNTRIIGASAKFQPFEDHQDTEFNLISLQGKHQMQSNEINQGSAWSVSAKSKLLKQRLNIETELAQSVFDPDSQGMSAKKAGRAYKLLMYYNPLLKVSNDDEKHKNTSSDDGSSDVAEIEFCLEKRWISPSFYSLANAALSNDLDSQLISATYSKNSLSLSASLEVQSDNVKHDPMKNTINNKLISTSLDYTPNSAQPQAWGEPRFGLSFSSSEQKSVDLPKGEEEIDKTVQTIEVSADFTYDTWNWNTQLSYDTTNDKSGHTNNTTNTELSFGIQKQFTESTQVSAQWQIDKQRWKSTAMNVALKDDLTLQLLILDGSTQLIKDKLNLSGSVTWSEQRRPQQLEQRSNTVELGLNWNNQKNSTQTFSPELWLKGQYSQSEDFSAMQIHTKTYQLMTGLSVEF
jgi:hypothetical protein